MMKKEIKKVNSENTGRIQKRLARTKAGFHFGVTAVRGHFRVAFLSRVSQPNENLESVAAFLSQTSFSPVDGLKISQTNSIEASPVALVIIGLCRPDGHQCLWFPSWIFPQTRTMILKCFFPFHTRLPDYFPKKCRK